MSEQILALVVENIQKNISDEQNGEISPIISPDSPLFGEGAVIDSLTLVNIIVDVEDSLLTKFNKSVCLSNDEAVFREPSPFTSITTLVDYIAELIDGP